MVLKSIISLEETKNERTYILSIPAGAPFGEAYDVAHSFLQQIAAMSQEAAAKAKPADNAPIEPEVV